MFSIYVYVYTKYRDDRNINSEQNVQNKVQVIMASYTLLSVNVYRNITPYHTLTDTFSLIYKYRVEERVGINSSTVV